MASKDQKVRATIAEQASEWFVANDSAPLDTPLSGALVDWLRASPVHVEELLAVSAIARDLRTVRTDPEYSVEAVLADAKTEDENPGPSVWSAVFAAVGGSRVRRWQSAALAVGMAGLLSLGLTFWNLRPMTRVPARPAAAAPLHFATRHGEQRSYRLADNSLVHLNTDSAVTIRYSPTERLVVLTSGEADFEVFHEPKRAFRVLAGPAEVVDVGTKFDVRLGPDATVVTVVEGRVAVEPSAMHGKAGSSNHDHGPRFVELVANQQISLREAEWPGTPVNVDAQRTTGWLHRQIAFDREPLGRVAEEFNRYAPKPIEIATPALRDLQISGVFSTDDTEEFFAFLRSLEGVRVEVTPTRVRVIQK